MSSALVVLADGDGKILAAAVQDLPDNGRIGIVPSDGQSVYDIVLPDGPEGRTLVASLHECYVKLEGGQPTLARR